MHIEHGKLVGRKSKEGKERFTLEVKKAINEGREWEVINRKRKRGKGVIEEIKMQ